MESYEINFNDNPEEYRAFIRVIRKVEILFGRKFFNDIQFYDPQPDPDLGYETMNESENVDNVDDKCNKGIENK